MRRVRCVKQQKDSIKAYAKDSRAAAVVVVELVVGVGKPTVELVVVVVGTPTVLVVVEDELLIGD